MYILTPSQMRKVDRYAIEEIKIPGVVLMENASRGIYEAVLRYSNSVRKKVVAFAGKGNNGADAMFATRMLFEDGYDVSVYLLNSFEEYKHEAKTALEILINLGVDVELFSSNAKIEADIVVDGIFGTGFRGKVEGLYGEAVCYINNMDVYVISVDIPSGINGLNGIGEEVFVHADETITFGAYKTGFFQNQGLIYSGDVSVRKIGLPKRAFASVMPEIEILEKDIIDRIIKSRPKDSNKGTFGKCMVVAGSRLMPGAGILSVLASLKMGTGLTYIATCKEVTSVYNIKVPEAILIPLESNEDGIISDSNVDLIVEEAQKKSSVAYGPGLSKNHSVYDVLKKLMLIDGINMVIDADGLNALVDHLEDLQKAKANIVVTPHPGEMARMLRITATEVQDNRVELTRAFAKEHKVITVLKGSCTLIAHPDGRTFVNTTGNSALAKAGSGDVLTGMIAGLMTNYEAFDSALIGVFVHGLCADIFVREKSDYSMLASDMMELIPKAMKEIGK